MTHRRPPQRFTMAAAGLVLSVVFLAGAAPALGYPVDPAPHPGRIKPVVAPAGYRNATITVIVQVTGDPIATAIAASPTGVISVPERMRLQRRILDRQAVVAKQVTTLGGRVLASYQSAYNGLKVRVAQRLLGAIRAIPGVTRVQALPAVTRSAESAIPSAAILGTWTGLANLHGEKVKVAVIDGGIDYTHADFGGAGTAGAYAAASEDDTSPPDPAQFGPGAPRVKGGIDLVGNDYDTDETAAEFQPIPHPDANPLDCDGHGSHVAGTLGGSGVLADGSTYTGAYTPQAVASQSWRILPGVAPKVDLYAVRVFGCVGSSESIIDGIDWAVAHGMNVISLSAGSAIGTATDALGEAATNATRAGVIFAAAAGNEGPSPYIGGSPASAPGVISVAASDGVAEFPGVTIHIGATTIAALNANNSTIPAGVTYTIKVITDDPATDVDESLGCAPEDFGTLAPNTLAVIIRGSCARVAKAIFGEQAGAAAVAMLNTSDALPPYEGAITSNADDNVPFDVTIPFIGLPGPADDETSPAGELAAADGQSATLTAGTIENPTFGAIADFSSAGPRTGDSSLTPSVTAPGVSVNSVLVGSGSDSQLLSGTSMATPYVGGVAALVRQAHPAWKDVRLIAAAIANTADPGGVEDWSPRDAGTGLARPAGATATDVVATGPGSAPAVNFGFAELHGDFRRTAPITVRNLGTSAVTFDVSTDLETGSPHTVSVPKRVTVPAGATRTLQLTLSVPASTAGQSDDFNDVGGVVVLKPIGKGNHGITVRLPYYLVPQTVSDVQATLVPPAAGHPNVVRLVNHGPGDAVADFFEWGLVGSPTSGLGPDDLRAAGAAADVGQQLLIFSVSTYHRWSNPIEIEIDVYVDVNLDGVDDYLVSLMDEGLLITGEVSGVPVVAVTTIATGDTSLEFSPDAPFNSSSVELPVGFEQLCDVDQPCPSIAHPVIAYRVASVSQLDATVDGLPGTALFNIYNPSMSTGMSVPVLAGETVNQDVDVSAGIWRVAPAMGVMVRIADNAAGPAEALLIPLQP